MVEAAGPAFRFAISGGHLPVAASLAGRAIVDSETHAGEEAPSDVVEEEEGGIQAARRHVFLGTLQKPRRELLQESLPLSVIPHRRFGKQRIGPIELTGSNQRACLLQEYLLRKTEHRQCGG